MKLGSIAFLTLFLTHSAFASSILRCSYMDKTKKVVVEEANIQSELKVNTSWVYREDCPQSIGIKYNLKEGNGVEYHQLSRSVTETQTAIQKCTYTSTSNDIGKFRQLNCDLQM